MTKNEYIFWFTFLKQRLREVKNENYRYGYKEIDIDFKDIFLGTPLSIEINRRRKYELFRNQG